jgi:hypothetical protein
VVFPSLNKFLQEEFTQEKVDRLSVRMADNETMSTETLVAQVKLGFIILANDFQHFLQHSHLFSGHRLTAQMRLGGEEKVFGCITPALYPSTTYERDVDGSYPKGKW